MKNRIFNSAPFLISIILAATLSVLYLSGISFLDMVELKAYDLRMKSRGGLEHGDEVVIAAIDEKSLHALGGWPWPRSTIALLLDKLGEYGARVIGFDIVFSEAEENSFLRNVDLIKRKLEENIADGSDMLEYLRALEQEANNDARLAEAVQDSGRVILGYYFYLQRADLEHIAPETLKNYFSSIEFSNYDQVFYTSREAGEGNFIKGYGVKSNIEVISKAALDFGYFNVIPDPDGVVRRLPLVVEYKGDDLLPGANLFPPLFFKMLLEFLGSPDFTLTINERGLEEVQLGDRVIPTDKKGMILINYAGGAKTYRHYSIADILKEEVPSDAFMDKMVLVGVTATGVHEPKVIPLEKNFPRVEIQANIIDNLLHNRYLAKPKWARNLDLAMILGLGIGLGLILRKSRAAVGALSLILIFAAFLYFNRYMFVERGVWLNVVYPGLNVIATFAAVSFYRRLTEGENKRFIQNAFGPYVAPHVVSRMIDNPDMLKLSGERRVLTAFFSDIQGFTSISERLVPEELVALINEYLTDMSDIILKYEGTIDKYEGGAIAAFFGAPISHEDHARRACLASIEMQEKIMGIRETWKEMGRPEIRVRIGLNTGFMVVGNMGARERMDYSIMGDTVKFTARLEAANKEYGTYMVIGEETYRQARDFIEVRELDLFRMFGRREPVRVYELLGKKGKLDSVKREFLKFFEQGLGAYREKEWDTAKGFFNRALSVGGVDQPCKVYIKRCEEFKVSPPPENWNGIHDIKPT